MNGPVQSGAVESEGVDEGTYYAITESGIFKVLLSIDNQQRIDGLRIQQLARATPLPTAMASLVFQP
jgi:hypothetical protein